MGLTSGVAQVALSARVAPRGSVQPVAPARDRSRTGSSREVSTSLRVVTNTGYRLTVRRASGTSSYILVRNDAGEFQALAAGSSVTVARDAGSAGESVREVLYRIESAQPETGELPEPVPIWCELAIDPTL
ncbi:MAG TPA: hypothetical protein VFZ87_02560 [Gemmatimonadales bacterium]